MKSDEKFLLGCWSITALISIAVWALILFVLIHFVLKVW